MPHCTSLLDDSESLQYISMLERSPQILHIASHTIPRDDAPLLSALRLSGSYLSVEQIYDLPLQGTELVTLSGCTTATGMESSGSLLAFQSAFFVAGAKHVLSSLWSVADAPTATWMNIFYQNLISGAEPAEAVRSTQLSLMNTSSLFHPAHWAAFNCSRR